MYEGFCQILLGCSRAVGPGPEAPPLLSRGVPRWEAQPCAACARVREKEGLDLYPGGAPGLGREPGLGGKCRGDEEEGAEQSGRSGHIFLVRDGEA